MKPWRAVWMRVRRAWGRRVGPRALSAAKEAARLRDGALLQAAEVGDADRLAAALAAGAQIEARDSVGCTPLLLCAVNDHRECLSALLGAGALIEVRDNEGRSPLIWSAWNGHTECLRMLLDAGADPNARDPDGWSVLLWAAGGGNEASIRMLLLAGADASARSNGGHSASMRARQRGHHKAAELIEGYSLALAQSRALGEDLKGEAPQGPTRSRL